METIADGRDTRWAAHRIARRRDLVEHALRAIRRHGAGVGMDEIATQAGTSKTVIYRHFGDRAGLVIAVREHVQAFIHRRLTSALAGSHSGHLGDLVGDLADAYLSLVERDPEIYRFVLSPQGDSAATRSDPLRGLPDLIGDQVTGAFAAHLSSRGQDPSCAATWGHGLVGFVRAAADHWMTGDSRAPRAEVVADICALFSPALAAVPYLEEAR